jgi:hypothetical protein
MADELLCQISDVIDVWPKFAALPATRQASLVSRASQKVLDHCRRGFIQQAVTEAHDGKNSPRLWLRRVPVITVSAVTVNGEAIDNSQGDGWTFKPRTGELVRGDGIDATRFAQWFPSGCQNVVVQYWGGYAAVPGPVLEATCWAAKWMSDRGKISGIFQSESIGDYSYSLADPKGMPLALPDEICALLAEYVLDEAFV